MQKFIFCFLLLLLPATYLLRAQTIKISVQKGQKYTVETSYQTTISMNMGSEAFETSMESITTFVYMVTEVDKNEIEMESICTRSRIASHSTIMGQKMSYDSDKKEGNDTTMSKRFSKGLGKTNKIVIDHSGKIIKAEKPEDTAGFVAESAWMFSGREGSTDLFKPEFIGIEFKEGYSFPFMTSYHKEKPSTSFSLNKETISVADTGLYTIDSIRNGIVSISYTGIHLLTLQMKIMDEFVTDVSRSMVRTDFLVDINTGIVISRTSIEETVMKEGNDKSTTTTKITQLE